MIIFMEIKVSKIKTVKSYIDTLRFFELGKTKYYELVHTDYKVSTMLANDCKTKMLVNSHSNNMKRMAKSIL